MNYLFFVFFASLRLIKDPKNGLTFQLREADSLPYNPGNKLRLMPLGAARSFLAMLV